MAPNRAQSVVAATKAMYRDNPLEVPHTEERTPRAAVLARFDDAAKLGMHDGRGVSGMWLIEEAGERKDVIRIYGMVPPGIRGQYEVYLARATTNRAAQKNAAGEGSGVK